jgi:hypothetical protein
MHMLVAQSLTVSHPLLRFLGKGAKSVFTTNETIVARIMVSGRTSFLIPIPIANFAQRIRVARTLVQSLRSSLNTTSETLEERKNVEILDRQLCGVWCTTEPTSASLALHFDTRLYCGGL